MNFISTFDELTKLYEEKTVKVKEACSKEALTENTDEEEVEIIDDEAPVEEMATEEPVDEDTPKQIVIECSKCGALVIVNDVVVDEESDLVNVEDECKFCEEKAGYKIVGTMVPYEAPEEMEEGLGIGAGLALGGAALGTGIAAAGTAKALTASKKAPKGKTELEEDCIEEDLADLYRKTFDKPASTKAQQSWEDELNGEMGEISDKRRKHLEKKFAQQRDWEKRHAKKADEYELEELLDVNANVDLKDFGGSNNKVSVLSPGVLSPGLESLDAEEAEELKELLDTNVKLDARGFGGEGNDVSVL